MKNSTELIKDKYEINSSTGIVVASGDVSKLGTIISINNLIETLYGYTDKQLVGQNISKLCPDFYMGKHEKYFEDFFMREDDDRTYLNTEQIVYAENLKGYVVPSSIMIKSLPEVMGHVKMVAFLMPVEKLKKSNNMSGGVKECGMLIEKESGGMLHGITENCTSAYGIRINMVYSKKNTDFRVEQIIPTLFLDDTFEKALESVDGIDIDMNTTVLKQENGADKDEDSFTIGLDNPNDLVRDSNSDDEKDENKRYKEDNVRIKIKPADKKSTLYYLTFHSNQNQNKEEGNLKELEYNDADVEMPPQVIEKEQTSSNRQEVSDDKRKILEFFTTIKDNLYPKKIKTMIRLYIFSVVVILVIASMFSITASHRILLQPKCENTDGRGTHSAENVSAEKQPHTSDHVLLPVHQTSD